jgi:hypothetical protein
MSAVAAEVYLALGYAAFLVAAAGLLDLMARHSHARSERYRTAGFDYDPGLDAWTCPEGEYLHRIGLDHERRVAHYRAKADVCNACPAKGECTDSDTGRTIARALDPWPHSEAGRFHRGIALAMMGLAALILALEAVRNHQPGELALLAPALAAVVAIIARASAVFRTTPTGFPDSSPDPGAVLR